MRYELRDLNGYTRILDTTDADTVGEWFKEWVPQLVSYDMRPVQCELRVWPQSEEENKLIGPVRTFGINQPGDWQVVARFFEELAAAAGQLPRRDIASVTKHLH